VKTLYLTRFLRFPTLQNKNIIYDIFTFDAWSRLRMKANQEMNHYNSFPGIIQLEL